MQLRIDWARMITLPDCTQRGGIDGDRCQCHSPWIAVPPAGVPLTFCQTCIYRNRNELPPVLTTHVEQIPECTHRGQVIAHRPATLCGLRGKLYQVYGCAIHGECVTRRTCQKQQEQYCLRCDDCRPE